MVCGNAGDAAAVYGAGDAGDGLDERCGSLVGGAGRRDDAVTVEAGAGEDLHVVGRIGKGNLVFLEAQVFQDLAGRCLETCAVGVIGIEVIEPEAVGLFQKKVGIPDDTGEPLRSFDDFVHADAAIGIHVNHVQGFGVKLQALGGAAEYGPHLAVQLIKVADVFSAKDFNADGAANGSEFPGIGCCLLFHMDIVLVGS